MAEARGYFGLCALDGKDLRSSRRLLVLPHRCSQVQLKGVGALEDETAQVLRVSPDMPDSAGAALGRALSFSPGAAGQFALIAPAAEMQQARRQLSDRMQIRSGASAD